MTKGEKMMKYYFAYGSNLKLEQMKKRCPDSINIGSSILKGYKLLFRKHHLKEEAFLTIEEDENESLPIGIFKISYSDELKLDQYEGVHKNCYRKEWLDFDFNGETINCLVYIMENPKKAEPKTEYIERIKQGYLDFGFDECYLEKALNECKG